jgi:predicted  nucleic acid-binding Zn-ribbon protein
MKNTIKLFIGLVLAVSLLTGCESSEEKVEEAKENLDEAQKELEIANEEYLKDFEQFKLEAANKIEANNKSIKDFNDRIADKKMKAKEMYQNKIADLDQKNTDLKKRMEDFKVEEKEDWEEFKVEFGNDLDTLGMAISKVFTIDAK